MYFYTCSPKWCNSGLSSRNTRPKVRWPLTAHIANGRSHLVIEDSCMTSSLSSVYTLCIASRSTVFTKEGLFADTRSRVWLPDTSVPVRPSSCSSGLQLAITVVWRALGHPNMISVKEPVSFSIYRVSGRMNWLGFHGQLASALRGTLQPPTPWLSRSSAISSSLGAAAEGATTGKIRNICHWLYQPHFYSADPWNSGPDQSKGCSSKLSESKESFLYISTCHYS